MQHLSTRFFLLPAAAGLLGGALLLHTPAAVACDGKEPGAAKSKKRSSYMQDTLKQLDLSEAQMNKVHPMQAKLDADLITLQVQIKEGKMKRKAAYEKKQALREAFIQDVKALLNERQAKKFEALST